LAGDWSRLGVLLAVLGPQVALHRLMPHGVFKGDVAVCATMEGQRLRRLVSAVRYSLRNGTGARSPEIAQLKAMCVKSPEKDRSGRAIAAAGVRVACPRLLPVVLRIASLTIARAPWRARHLIFSAGPCLRGCSADAEQGRPTGRAQRPEECCEAGGGGGYAACSRAARSGRHRTW
jgi:hypothetical protein